MALIIRLFIKSTYIQQLERFTEKGYIDQQLTRLKTSSQEQHQPQLAKTQSHKRSAVQKVLKLVEIASSTGRPTVSAVACRQETMVLGNQLSWDFQSNS
jgi:hypothetical protein